VAYYLAKSGSTVQEFPNTLACSERYSEILSELN